MKETMPGVVFPSFFYVLRLHFTYRQPIVVQRRDEASVRRSSGSTSVRFLRPRQTGQFVLKRGVCSAPDALTLSRSRVCDYNSTPKQGMLGILTLRLQGCLAC